MDSGGGGSFFSYFFTYIYIYRLSTCVCTRRKEVKFPENIWWCSNCSYKSYIYRYSQYGVPSGNRLPFECQCMSHGGSRVFLKSYIFIVLQETLLNQVSLSVKFRRIFHLYQYDMSRHKCSEFIFHFDVNSNWDVSGRQVMLARNTIYENNLWCCWFVSLFVLLCFVLFFSIESKISLGVN